MDITDERSENLANNPNFQYIVASCYYHGYAIEQNYTEWVKWVRLAAKQERALPLQALVW